MIKPLKSIASIPSPSIFNLDHAREPRTPPPQGGRPSDSSQRSKVPGPLDPKIKDQDQRSRSRSRPRSKNLPHHSHPTAGNFSEIAPENLQSDLCLPESSCKALRSSSMLVFNHSIATMAQQKCDGKRCRIQFTCQFKIHYHGPRPR